MPTVWREQSPGFSTAALAASTVVTFLRHSVMPPAHRVPRSALEISSVLERSPPGEAG